MKTKHLFGILLLFLCTVSLVSCQNDDEPQDKVETMEAHISAITCIGGILLSNDLIEGMLVKVGNESDYHFFNFNEISGFTYQRGYEYNLQIERTTLANPPADGSMYNYRLVKEKSKKEGEGIRENKCLYVSAETGIYKWGNITQDISSQGMKIRENADEEWTVVPFNKISGFEYENGYNYELSVEKIVLSAQPENEWWQTTQYILREVISKEKAE
ncbi:DUF4377 domain-containing protein [Bacteroides sp.]